MIEKISGRNIHRFLIKEAFRIFKNKGYNVRIEEAIGKRKVDVFAEKKREKIAIECFVKPTISHVKKKTELKKFVDKLVIVYPSSFVPSFPIEDYGEIIRIDVPPSLTQSEKKSIIQISDELWHELNKQREPGETFQEVLERLIEKGEKNE